MIHGPHGVAPLGAPPMPSMYGGMRMPGFNPFAGQS